MGGWLVDIKAWLQQGHLWNWLCRAWCGRLTQGVRRNKDDETKSSIIIIITTFFFPVYPWNIMEASSLESIPCTKGDQNHSRPTSLKIIINYKSMQTCRFFNISPSLQPLLGLETISLSVLQLGATKSQPICWFGITTPASPTPSWKMVYPTNKNLTPKMAIYIHHIQKESPFFQSIILGYSCSISGM